MLPLARATESFTELRSLENRAFAGFFAARAELNPEWMSFFGSFGMILSFLYDPDEILSTNLKRCAVETVVSLDPRPTDRHISRHLCSILDSVGIAVASYAPVLKFGCRPTPIPRGDQVSLHPGSGSEKKNWALDRWISILEFLAGRNIPMTLLSGEADEERTRHILAGFRSPLLTVVRNRPLLEVATLLQSARLFIGHDSGITHLAAALQAPTLALFGPTNPCLWAPANPGTRVLWKNRIWYAENASLLELGEISVDENSPELVKAQITELLEL